MPRKKKDKVEQEFDVINPYRVPYGTFMRFVFQDGDPETVKMLEKEVNKLSALVAKGLDAAGEGDVPVNPIHMAAWGFSIIVKAFTDCEKMLPEGVFYRKMMDATRDTMEEAVKKLFNKDDDLDKELKERPIGHFHKA